VQKYFVSAFTFVACVGCGQISNFQLSPFSQVVEAVAQPTAGHWQTAGLNICSKLDFESITWPAGLTPEEQNAFALGLNISGSFEGSDGWRNITNDFDGEGLSLGLLNQCLGEGSLQPMLTEMIQKHTDLMKQIFIAGTFESLEGMLTQWQKRGMVPDNEDQLETGFSSLDDEDVVADFLKRKPKPKPKPKPKTRNEESVDWAVKNLYLDSKGIIFTPAWMLGFTGMSDTAEYRSLQLAKAHSLHQGAMALFHHFKMTQVRSYLFFFDIMVQNGGINSDVIDSIDATLTKKEFSETEKLERILTIRLKFVRKKYAADVKSRKESLIKGGGFVHGINRSYDLEYCARLNSQLYPDSAEVENYLNL